MRIAIANRTSQPVGGAEEYLARVTSSLRERGHELAAMYEESPVVPDLGFEPSWSINRLGIEATLSALRAWRPDVVYCNGLNDPEIEVALTSAAPSVYSAHAYFGTCISGRKMHSLPSFQPCEKEFGPACLLHYFPRRCGGLNPITMASSYRRESTRLRAIRRYSVVVSHSRHMQREYARHRVETVYVPLPLISVTAGRAHSAIVAAKPRRLLYVGRMTKLKGGLFLIDALDRAQREIGRPIEVSFAGDGPDRAEWQERSQEAERRNSQVTIKFLGLVSASARDELLRSTHGIVVPSVWPEPFGMVGLEAAAFGVPAIAFDVGGISEWLVDGQSGFLVQAKPPSAARLAQGIVACVGEPETHAKLSNGAVDVYKRFASLDAINGLESAFNLARERSGLEK